MLVNTREKKFRITKLKNSNRIVIEFDGTTDPLPPDRSILVTSTPWAALSKRDLVVDEKLEADGLESNEFN